MTFEVIKSVLLQNLQHNTSTVYKTHIIISDGSDWFGSRHVRASSFRVPCSKWALCSLVQYTKRTIIIISDGSVIGLAADI